MTSVSWLTLGRSFHLSRPRHQIRILLNLPFCGIVLSLFFHSETFEDAPTPHVRAQQSQMPSQERLTLFNKSCSKAWMHLEEGLHLGQLSVSLWSPAPLHCPIYCPIHCAIFPLAHVSVSLATFLCRSDLFLLKQPLGGWQRVVSFFWEDAEPTLSPALTALVSLPSLSQEALWMLWPWSHPATEIPGVSSKQNTALWCIPSPRRAWSVSLHL